MAQYLIARYPELKGQIDPDVAEFAGRAHDIGHPPFGHLGEKVLNHAADSRGLTDGFEGNAQTFRVLASLIRRKPVKSPDADAPTTLELTNASLAATVKYPYSRDDAPEDKKKAGKFGFIAPDKATFETKVKPLLVDGKYPTLEAQIMDWADDITYATHDIEDFGANARIPLGLLRHNPNGDPASRGEIQDFRDYANAKLRSKVPDFSSSFDQFIELSKFFPERLTPGNRANATLLGRITSHIITQATDKTDIHAGMLEPDPIWRGTIDILKELTWFYMIHNPDLVRVQRGQKKRLEAVTRELLEWVDSVYDANANPTEDDKAVALRQLPEFLRELVLEYTKANNRHTLYRDDPKASTGRAVIDFVASMTESEVDQYYEEMCN